MHRMNKCLDRRASRNPRLTSGMRKKDKNEEQSKPSRNRFRQRNCRHLRAVNFSDSFSHKSNIITKTMITTTTKNRMLVPFFQIRTSLWSFCYLLSPCYQADMSNCAPNDCEYRPKRYAKKSIHYRLNAIIISSFFFYQKTPENVT